MKRSEVFFRIIDSVNTFNQHLTIQGDRLNRGDFTTQEYAGFQGGGPGRRVTIHPKGSPKVASLHKMQLEELVNHLRFWRVVKTAYSAPIDLRFGLIW